MYEDGNQSRDFVSVHDVTSAFLLALDTENANGHACNIGSGVPTSILDLARTLNTLTGIVCAPDLPGKYRKNDVCHCFADTTKAGTLLGWRSTVTLNEGLRELITWSAGQCAVDGFAEAERILRSKSLQS